MRILPGAGHRQPCQLVKPSELLELFFGNFGFYGIEIEIKSLETRIPDLFAEGTVHDIPGA